MLQRINEWSTRRKIVVLVGVAVVLTILINAISGALAPEEASQARNTAASVEAPAPEFLFSPVELMGHGEDTRTVMLPAGLYTVDMSVSGNQGRNFIVWVESVGGGRDLIANDRAAEWSSRTTVRVGDWKLAPGKHIVSVDAVGDWKIRIEKE